MKAHTGGSDWQSRWNDAADALAKAAATSAEPQAAPPTKPTPALSRPEPDSYTGSSLVPAFLPPPSHSLLPPPRIVDSRAPAPPRKRAAAPAAAAAAAHAVVPSARAALDSDVRSFGSDDDLSAAVEAMSGAGGGARGDRGRGRGGGSGAKKPFYNKAYASKYYWTKNKKKGGGDGEGGRGRGGSTSSGGRRGGGGAAATGDSRQGRARGGEGAALPLFDHYGEQHDVLPLLRNWLLLLMMCVDDCTRRCACGGFQQHHVGGRGGPVQYGQRFWRGLRNVRWHVLDACTCCCRLNGACLAAAAAATLAACQAQLDSMCLSGSQTVNLMPEMTTIASGSAARVLRLLAWGRRGR